MSLEMMSKVWDAKMPVDQKLVALALSDGACEEWFEIRDRKYIAKKCSIRVPQLVDILNEMVRCGRMRIFIDNRNIRHFKMEI